MLHAGGSGSERGWSPVADQCSATSKGSGVRCRNPAIPGGTVCRFHGASGKVRAAAARRVAEAELRAEVEAAQRVGVELDDRPLAEVALQLVRVWRGTELFLRERVQELDQLTRGSKELEAALAVLGGGGKESERIAQRAPSGLYGQVDPRNWKAERHVVYAMWEDASDRVMRYVKACREAGVEEARLELEQEKVRQLAEVISATLRAVLGLVVEVVRGAGVENLEVVLREAWTVRVPQIVRAQIEAHEFDRPAA